MRAPLVIVTETVMPIGRHFSRVRTMSPIATYAKWRDDLTTEGNHVALANRLADERGYNCASRVTVPKGKTFIHTFTVRL